MKNLTLIIPAKAEADSLPKVLEEIKNFDCSVIVVLESSDIDTVKATQNYDLEIVYQLGKGYGDAIIGGINNVKTEYKNVINNNESSIFI